MELFKVDFGLTIWMFVSFLILFFLLWKFAWPAIIKGIDGRADLIDKGVEYAQNAKEQLDNAQEEARKEIAKARHQQADIIAEANKMKAQIIEQAHDEAKVEAQKVMDAAKVSIEQSRREAEKNLRDQVSQVALEIADRVTRDQMKDTQAQKRLVNSILDEIETTN
ncbi:MAG: F0F1 ATP synthase subunit B [[Clostridium] fimetarium]|nr:F0F1 ATP synthase subunit B [Alistipes timonensis]MCM1405081.1 F0F1 ATP synthase subunit B [[Clostridium] fimetarium]